MLYGSQDLFQKQLWPIKFVLPVHQVIFISA
jgi:hypothetical protein